MGFHLPIRYYGPGGSIRQFSAARILRGDLDADDLRGQVVVLGATAVGVGDTFATPFDRVVPGVAILATGTGLVRRIDAGAAVALSFLTVLLMSMRRGFVGLGLAGVVITLWGSLTR